MAPLSQQVLTPLNADGTLSALTGNGELCTTLSPTGYHTAPESACQVAHRTQYFVWAGRRRSGPQHPLIHFGSLAREVEVDGQGSEATDWQQQIDEVRGEVHSFLQHRQLREQTRSFVALADNLFFAETMLINADGHLHEVTFRAIYRLGEPDVLLDAIAVPGGVHLSYQLEDHLGDLVLATQVVQGAEPPVFLARLDGAVVTIRASLEPGSALALRLWLHFSDRLHYEDPITADGLDAVLHRHADGWAAFWARSEVVTGDQTVDAFRRRGLYTLRCQATPWSIPPTLSKPYWDGGAFHDELYPFFGLLSANHPELAERIPYFRLMTLPRACERARGRGALFPWSSTEAGAERDPNGPWLTERFHLGQFAACVWALWLYQRDLVQLDDLYPVLRELARYYELNLLERDVAGRLQTRACLDFDESVGAVTNGPFTISAAIASLEYAAAAANELGRDQERAGRWRSLAMELRRNLPGDEQRFCIPDGKPLHYSIVGPIFPFRVDVDSPRARATAGYVHQALRSARGWKPGVSEAYEGSNWMWTAGHLGIVHALQGDAELAWEAIRGGPASAGPFLSPNEHLNRHGEIQVPWFTTGVGGWLYALHALFVQVDEEGSRLLPAVPANLPVIRFRDLRADRGVLVSGELRGGDLFWLAARAPHSLHWRYRLPARYAQEGRIVGRVIRREGGWVEVEEVALQTDDTPLTKW